MQLKTENKAKHIETTAINEDNEHKITCQVNETTTQRQKRSKTELHQCNKLKTFSVKITL